ncbi:hypothetical protein [Blastococcus brunescens]|uniref:DUF4352 domain-containing protein n=1 Tax=Blastococcus brunescens TaxID=1564165 RepID=A0ABZ1B7C6_9ACTN|nr:hypothetical protein [Blastococcus sp. BMG 8361]WRL65768.1 hypothetical protein U6N30_09430 [Blastococcus sp. BMG 8361]
MTAVQPVPDPVVASGGTPAAAQGLHALGGAWAPVDESEPAGGPSRSPRSGSCSRTTTSGTPLSTPPASRSRRGRTTRAPHRRRLPSRHGLPLRRRAPPRSHRWRSRQPLPGLSDSAAPPTPATPSTPPTPTPPTSTSPPSTAPTSTEPPSTAPTSTPPTSTPPTTPPPTTPPPTTPPAEESPPPPPPTDTDTDTTLALGQRHEYVDADGNVELSITLVSVSVEQGCAAGSIPPENGHLIGLHLEVVDPDPPAAAGQPSISAADFRFHDADDVLTTDVDTAAAAACLEDGWLAGPPGPDGPVEGTVVLDVPSATGTIVYRPEGRPAGLRWQVSAAG